MICHDFSGGMCHAYHGRTGGFLWVPIGSMVLLYIYMVTFTINIPPMFAYIPYMDPMGDDNHIVNG